MIEYLADSANASSRDPSVPNNDDSVADIVAVHGIYEGGRATWTDQATNALWLRDLFPHQSLRVRLLSFTYQLQTVAVGATDDLLSLATNLVGELCAERLLTGTTRRPIIFVCHGFGGLIVKKALVYSESKRAIRLQHLRDVYVSTSGVIFFATPHRGIERTTLLLHHESSVTNRRGPTQLELSLMKDSELLQDIEDQFAPMTRRLDVYNLWEGVPTRFGKQHKCIVEKESAAPGWPDADSNEIAASHSQITKFPNKAASGYQLVLSALLRFIDSARTEIPKRWDTDIELMQNERHHEAEELLGTQIPHRFGPGMESHHEHEWFSLPRGSSKYFTGRTTETDTVRNKLGPTSNHEILDHHQVFVIYGLGGSGKTQFCLRYAEENRPKLVYPYWGIFWIDASSTDTAEAGYTSLGKQAQRGSSCGAGMLWLSQSKQPWLLILDNADDPHMDISSYLPAGGGGHVIITTRNPGVIDHNTAGYLRFSGMDPEEGLNLFLRTAFAKTELAQINEADHKAAQSIASELGYLALALSNAGTAIRLKIYTLEKYLHYYLGQRKRTVSSPSIRSIADADIVSTWEIPFQTIARTSGQVYRDAVDLLHLLAFMHFDSVPERIFYRSRQMLEDRDLLDGFVEQWTSSEYCSEDIEARLRASLSVLYSHSLVDHDEERQVISLHPVIHQWARNRLSKADQQHWLNAAISILAHCVSLDLEASGRQFRQSLLPHMEACLKNVTVMDSKVRINTRRRATEIEKFALVFAENGQWTRVLDLQEGVIKFRKTSLGRLHPHTVRAQRIYAESQWNTFNLAKVLRVQAELRWTLFLSRPSWSDWVSWPPWYPEHTSYCLNLSDLTRSLWLAGDRNLAKWTGQRAVNGLNKRLGPDDPLTLTAKFNFARTLMHLGNHQESHKLLVEVLHKRRRLFGYDHPDTLMARNELGVSLYFQRKCLAASQRILENTVIARKKVLGAEHAYTLWSMNDLAKVYSARGNHTRAIEKLEEVLPIARRTLGETHVGVFMTESNLARTCVLAQRWTEAEIVILRLRNKTPAEHPDYILLISGYVYVLISSERLAEAETECLRALSKAGKGEKNLRDSRQLLSVAQHLALVYQKQGRENEIAVLKQRFPSLGEVYELHFSI